MTAKVYSSFRILKISLGRLDGAHELAHLGLLNLKSSKPETCQDFSTYVGEIAKTHNLHVRVKSPEEAFRVVALSGIASAHACYNEFLRGFCQEIRDFKKINIDLDRNPQGESKHKFVVDELSKNKDINKTSKFELLNLLMELLRLVRNAEAHKGSPSTNKFSNLLKRVVDCEDWCSVFNSRNKPSSFKDIEYADFLLYTHAVRCMAEYWCLEVLPSATEIAQHPDLINFIKTSKVKKLPQFLRGRFALDPDDSNEVIFAINK